MAGVPILRNRVNRKIAIGDSEIIVSITHEGIALRPPGKIKALVIPWRDLIYIALAGLDDSTTANTLKKNFRELKILP